MSSSPQSSECDHRSTEKGWRDIASAPKDGTKFIAWPAMLEGGIVAAVTAWWYSHPSTQGWITDAFDCGDYEFSPTHWTPSPGQPPAHQENSPRSGGETRELTELEDRLLRQALIDSGSPEPAPQVREALEREEKYLHALIDDEDVGSVMHGDIEGAFHRLQTALTPVVAREPVQANTEQVHGKGDQLSMERTAISDVMIDAALNAWFKSPPSESDMGLERSMGAALEAASLIANQNDLRGSQPETATSLPPASAVREALEGLNFVIEFCRRDMGYGWNPMAAFDNEGPAESYLAQQRADEKWPWIYRIRALSQGTDLKQADETSEKSR